MTPPILNVGKLFAMTANSRAFYPNFQQSYLGKAIGHASFGFGPEPTEAEVDAYLSDPACYPVGKFNKTQDRHDNPVKNTPLFRQDLAAPNDSAGEFRILDDIGNASYITNLDPTTLITPEGCQLLEARAGPAGKQLEVIHAANLKERKPNAQANKIHRTDHCPLDCTRDDNSRIERSLRAGGCYRHARR